MSSCRIIFNGMEDFDSNWIRLHFYVLSYCFKDILIDDLEGKLKED